MGYLQILKYFSACRMGFRLRDRNNEKDGMLNLEKLLSIESDCEMLTLLKNWVRRNMILTCLLTKYKARNKKTNRRTNKRPSC
jgi:hypothetical protein